MIWVINTNSNVCQIYQYQKKPATLALIQEISHPENRLKKSDFLTSDKPGHYRSDTSGGGGAFSPHTDPKQAAVDAFAREIAKELNHARTNNKYEKLIVIAPPHMMGSISKHLDKHVKTLISNHIEKDLPHIKQHELLALLQADAQFPDS